MDDKDTELLCKVTANHLFLAQFEPFRATLRSLRARNPDIARAILQTIVAKGGRFDSILWSHSCPSPAILTFLCTLELLEFNEPTSNLWSFDADTLKLRAEFLLYLQAVIFRVSESLKKGTNVDDAGGNGMNRENLDPQGELSGKDEGLKGLGVELDECLSVLERISDMGLSRLKPDLIEIDHTRENEGTSGSDIVVQEEEIILLRRVFLEHADIFDALCVNIQKQVSWIEGENSAMALALRTTVKHNDIQEKVLKLIQRSVQISHLDAMKECLEKDDVDGAVSHIRFLNLDNGVEENEHRYVHSIWTTSLPMSKTVL